jgi:hypothetical protein
VLDKDGHPLDSHGSGYAGIRATAKGAAVRRGRQLRHGVLSAGNYGGRPERRKVAEVEGGSLGVSSAVLPWVDVLRGANTNEALCVPVHLRVLDGYKGSSSPVLAAEYVGIVGDVDPAVGIPV